MIFNSISRDINQNERSRNQFISANSQGSYFPQKSILNSNIFDKASKTNYPIEFS